MRRWPVRAFICPGLARQANLDLGAILKNLAVAALRAPGEFPKVEVGYWDHSLSWPSGANRAQTCYGSKPWANATGRRNA